MGSTGKKRTTFAKLNRESKLREKRAAKQARKAARKLPGASETAFPASAEAEGIESDGGDAGVADGAAANGLPRPRT